MKPHALLTFAATLLGAFAFGATAVAKDSTQFEAVQLRVDVDRTQLPANAEDRAIVKVCLDGMRLPRPENRPPVNIAIVIDRSGSMSGSKMVHAKEAALAALARLAADDVVSVVTYDSEVETLVPATPVGSGERIAAAIRSITARGNTALFGGVSQGAAEVRKHLEDTRFNPRVILVSDGLANVGPSSPDDLARLGAGLMKEGISVTTIGLGLGFNEDLMTKLAQRSDGNTYFVESSADLPGIFAAELGDVLNVVARRVVLHITFPEGVNPRALVGREGTVRGQQVEIQLNQLYGGQAKFALVEVDVSGADDGAVRKIAEARVTYDDVLRPRRVTLTSMREVTYTSDRKAVVRSANLKLQTEYAENALAEAKDRAVLLADANRKAEAAEEIRRKAEELAQVAKVYSNRTMLAVTEVNRTEAERLERDGLDNAQRKTYRAESAQTKTQQSSRSGSYTR